MSKNTGKQFISELKLHTDYLKFDNVLGRYEKWHEAIDSILAMHASKYGERVGSLLEEIRPSLVNREFLASQRNLQFRGESIFKHNTRMYNCCTTYAYSPDLFKKAFYILLCGCGLGVSLKRKFTQLMPRIEARGNEVLAYQVEDSIEGWANAVHVLISSFCQHPSLEQKYFGKQIKFDFSLIRPKGAFITGGFKAPGPDGLKSSIEKIETLLSANVGDFKSILVYDTLMHIADAVLSGGVRRSATCVVIDEDDQDMINAKVGSWYIDNPQRGRSNNSVGLIKGKFTHEQLDKLVKLNQGDNDLGFVFMNHEDEVFNPCFEIGFNFYNEIKNLSDTAVQFCNLNEINASASVDEQGNFSEEKFYSLCRYAAILGTLQAGYTDFPFLGNQTEAIVRGEALIGVSITGWMTRPELFNESILKKGADIVKAVNSEVAKIIGINPAARTTTVKPSGNASVILQTASGIHPEHAKRYFRLMQLNKESETAKYLEQHMPDLLEESEWSASKSDYIVYIPVENNDEVIVKDQMTGIKHLELIRLVQNSWVSQGKNQERCYNPLTSHNVSNTVIIDDLDLISQYLFDNQKDFTAVSFASASIDLDYVQAPFTAVKSGQEMLDKYGEPAQYMSGLIVDGLHYFNNNLWAAIDYVVNGDKKMSTATRDSKLLRDYWVSRVRKFATNEFNGDLNKTLYCMKDIHLSHKWRVVKRTFALIDFSSILNAPTYKDVSQYAAVACAGGSCEIV